MLLVFSLDGASTDPIIMSMMNVLTFAHDDPSLLGGFRFYYNNCSIFTSFRNIINVTENHGLIVLHHENNRTTELRLPGNGSVASKWIYNDIIKNWGHWKLNPVNPKKLQKQKRYDWDKVKKNKK